MSTEDGGENAAPRKVTDAKALRALAHPTRIDLLEAIGLRGALTATEAAEIVGGSVPNVAYHLRTLAKYGYLVEAEHGSGRERPWRIGSIAISTDEEDLDPVAAHAAEGLGEVMLERALQRFRRFQSLRDQYPGDQRAASGRSQAVLFATPAEIEQVQDEIVAIMMRFAPRIQEPGLRPEGAVPFELLTVSYPFETPGASDAAAPDVAPDTAPTSDAPVEPEG